MAPRTPNVSLRDIYEARLAIASHVRRTALRQSVELTRRPGTAVHLKLETMHDIGAFKIRGATNRLAALTPRERSRGVVTVSTGNHGRAVAQAARRLGIAATVCMSELVPANKRRAIEALGADLRIVGRSQDAAQAEADRLTAENGLVPVHPFDDPRIIAGQGTIGLELLEDLARVDCVLAALSGGGLLGGIAVSLKAAWPATRVIGVSMERGPAMYRSVQAGKPVDVVEEPTLADSLGGGIGLDNQHTFELIRSLVDDYILVSEREIGAAMTFLYEHEHLVVEGGGAVGVAAVLSGRAGRLSGNVACVLSGGNVDTELFTRIVTGRYDYRD